MRVTFAQLGFVLANEPWRSVFPQAMSEQFDAFLARSPSSEDAVRGGSGLGEGEPLSPFERDLLADQPQGQDPLGAWGTVPAEGEDSAWDETLQDAAEIYYLLVAAEGNDEEVMDKARLEAAYPEDPKAFAALSPDHPPHGVSVEAFLDFLLEMHERKGKDEDWVKTMLATVKARFTA